MLVKRVFISFGDQDIARFVKEAIVAHMAFEHLSRRLAFAEARDFDALHKLAVRLVKGALHLLRVDLNLEDNLAVGDAVRGNLHAFNYSKGVC